MTASLNQIRGTKPGTFSITGFTGSLIEGTSPIDLSPIADYDGNLYTSVTIGTRQWLIEPLKTTHYNNGSAIPNITDNDLWMADTAGAYCWYNNDIANKTVYGALYNWFAVDTGKLAITGWRVPTRADFWSLVTFRIDNEFTDEGYKLKEIDTTHWQTPNTSATDELGFKALPHGRRKSTDGTFLYNLQQADMWSSDETGGNGYRFNLRYNSVEGRLNYESNIYGFTVRLVRDI